MATRQLIIKCPYCKKQFDYHASEYRPFCSKKCQLIDMGKWLDESYTIPETSFPEDEEDQP